MITATRQEQHTVFMTKYTHYHLIGIGGIGMSGIAHLLLRRGFQVSGSDLKESKITEELRRLGARVSLGHNALHAAGADVVVYSSAVAGDNPEMVEARRRGTPVLKRAEALAHLMEQKVVVTVTGSHGKTTTASLVSYLLLEAGLGPTLAVGGILRNIDTNACSGDGKFFVAEADESDGSFLYYHPDYSIITNIDHEHLDYYKDFASAVKAFGAFIGNTKAGGCVFACSDDAVLRELLKDHAVRHVFFGLGEGADVYPRNILIKDLSSEFDAFHRDTCIGRFQLSLGGRHNVSNALSVIAVARELGIDTACIKRALLNYKGAKRRLEVKFKDRQYLVLDDYAHHPTEIRATLAAIRSLSFDRAVAVFQPHRYTRTSLLLEEFGRSFDSADYVVVTDIYPANEPPLAGVHARLICDKIRECCPSKEVHFVPKEEIVSHLMRVIRPRDLVITLGAGDIVKTCDELVEALKGKG